MSIVSGTQVVKQALVACGSSFLVIYICIDLFTFVYCFFLIYCNCLECLHSVFFSICKNILLILEVQH